MRKAILLMALAAFALFAEDFAGTWKGGIETAGGNFDMTLVLKAAGDAYTGTISGPGGDTKIENVKVAGDKVTFSMTMEFGTLTYTGVIKGDDLKLSISFGDGGMAPMETTLKRSK